MRNKKNLEYVLRTCYEVFFFYYYYFYNVTHFKLVANDYVHFK